MNANIQEIFWSIQGEGRLVGVPMLFVRFSECNLRCRYCDTKRAWKKSKDCLVYLRNKKVKIPNDVSTKDLFIILQTMPLAEYISFTGGEPTMNAEYIAEFCQLAGRRWKYLLETNGTLPEKVPLLKKIDVFSIDYKEGKEVEFKEFIKAVSSLQKDFYVKIVVGKSNYWQKLRFLLKKRTEVYVQPEFGKKVDLFELSNGLSGLNFKVIPQMHKFLKIL